MSDDTRERLKEHFAGRYVLGQEVERGGMAVVYAADDVKHRRRVAIKVLKPALAETLGAQRFLREIEVVARLQHPHILTLIDSGEVDGLPYYVMPYVEGLSLKDRLERGRLPVDEAVRIASEMADALEAAHNGGVIHRDIKPGNVLLSGGHAMVADFGIAAAADEAALGRLTETGISLGSPAYMSPEQASGERNLDRRTDIYGVGCVLYEMLAGTPPFQGSIKTVLSQKVLGTVRPLRELRPDVPPAVELVVSKAMATEPDARFSSSGELRRALLASLPAAGTQGATRRRRLAAAAVVLVALAAALAVQRSRAEGARALRAAQQLVEVERLVDAGRFGDALVIAEEVEAVVPGDTTLARLLPRFTFTIPIRTEPPGARVYLQEMDGPEDAWQDVGVTPIAGVRFAGLTFPPTDQMLGAYEAERPWRLRFELDGYQNRELLLPAILGAEWRGVRRVDPVPLTPLDPALESMVRIPGFTLNGTEYDDYFMDRHEVTNAQFKAFVDAGGYEDPAYWVHPVLRDGDEISFAEAMGLFRDQTGRPGPSTWRLGTYPDGQVDYPVGGVSWYEAAAYARFVGKELPSTAQWARGRLFAREDSYAVDARSNLGSAGPRAVGQERALTSLGVYDLGGNVREWCLNEAGDGQRATRGAAWPDAPFHVGWIIPKAPLDRDATHGFRLVRAFDDEETLAALRFPVTRTVIRDYGTERAASDAEFAVFRRLYDYSPTPLDALVERTDTAEHWVREVVTFDLPYGERGGAVLYLPTTHQRPLQAVVYWGGSGLLRMRSVDEEWVPAFDFIVRSGRAVAIPILQGAYGREDPRPAGSRGLDSPSGREDYAYREIAIQWVTDVRRTLDYLETRPDLDPGRMAYYGFSFGGRQAPVALAVEPRLKAAVLNVGGLSQQPAYLPEVDPFHFVPRVTTPILMINGEHDIVFPYETSQRPMFERLGTPPEHKRHHITPAAHIVPLDELITQTLGWLDQYLGVPAGT